MTKSLDLLVNGKFSDSWVNFLPYGALINQQPYGFGLTIRRPEEPLLSAGADLPDDEPRLSVVKSIPECVHKHNSQLPPEERIDGSRPLVLAGAYTYKVFAAHNPFSAILEQPVFIPFDGVLTVGVPVQVHQHGDGSPGAAVWKVMIGDDGTDWQTFGHGFEDREWVYAASEREVEQGDIIDIILYMESRAEPGIDFWTDHWKALLEYDEKVACRGLPREPYTRIYNVIPQDATEEEAIRIFKIAWERGKQTVGGSSDDAGIGDLPDKIAVEWNRIEPSHYVEFYEQNYPGTAVIFDSLDAYTEPEPEPEPPEPEPEPEPPPPEPEPEPEPEPWTPRRYIEKGTVMGWHAIGNCGLPELHADVQAPTIKLLIAVNDIGKMPARYRTVRLIDAPGYGNLEGFSYTQNPEAQAEARIAQLAEIYAPLAGQFHWAEYVNEQDIPDYGRADRIARFAIRAMEVAPPWLGLAHFSFGPGNPADLSYWDPIADTGVFEKIAARGDAIALHSYHDHRVLGDIDHLLLRHRDLYNKHILPRRLDIPLILTECGPWRHLLRDDSFNLMEWIIVTDDALREDPYAMAQMYTVSDVPGWQDYSTAFKAIYPEYIRWAKSLEGRINDG